MVNQLHVDTFDGDELDPVDIAAALAERITFNGYTASGVMPRVPACESYFSHPSIGPVNVRAIAQYGISRREIRFDVLVGF